LYDLFFAKKEAGMRFTLSLCILLGMASGTVAQSVLKQIEQGAQGAVQQGTKVIQQGTQVIQQATGIRQIIPGSLPNPDPTRPYRNIIAQAQQAGKTSARLFDAITHGDGQKVKEAIGDAFLTSPNCLGCKQFAQTVFPNLTPEQIDRIAGEGVLTFVGTQDPVLLVVDVANNIVRETSLKPGPQPPIPPAPTTTAPSPKVYTSGATCMLEKDRIVWVGWKDTPMVTNSNGQSFPLFSSGVSLQDGDIINVTSPSPPCAGWVTGLTSAKFRVEGPNPAPANNVPPDAPKTFLKGPSVP
jgi:hypothetical protein